LKSYLQLNKYKRKLSDKK